MFKYSAIALSIHDGDTLTVDINLASLPELQTLKKDFSRIDLGFSVDIPLEWAELLSTGQQQIWLRSERIRLYGINCPELKDRSGAGIKARDYVRSLIAPGDVLTLQTLRVKTRTQQEKFGRYLGIIFLENDLNLNQHLLEVGHAVKMMF